MSQPQGDGQPQNPQGEGDKPQYVTTEQLNQAITNRFKPFEKKVEDLFAKSGDAILAKLSETIDQRFDALKTQPEKKTDPAPQIEDHPSFKGLQKQLQDLQKAADTAKAEAEAEKAKTREAKLRQRLGDELAGHGIDPTRAKHAVGYLIDVEKRVRWSEDDADAIVFRDADGQDLDFGTGMKAWAKSEDAKIYMAPRGTQGSGDRGVGNPRAANPSQGVKPGAIGNWIVGLANGGGPGGA